VTRARTSANHAHWRPTGGHVTIKMRVSNRGATTYIRRRVRSGRASHNESNVFPTVNRPVPCCALPHRACTPAGRAAGAMRRPARAHGPRTRGQARHADSVGSTDHISRVDPHAGHVDRTRDEKSLISRSGLGVEVPEDVCAGVRRGFGVQIGSSGTVWRPFSALFILPCRGTTRVLVTRPRTGPAIRLPSHRTQYTVL
jgi:hypothetical protein